MHLNAPTSLAGAERVLLTYLENRDRDRYVVRVTSCLNHRRMENTFTEALDRLEVPCDRVPIGNTGLAWQVKQVARLIQENGVNVLHTHGYRSDIIGLAAAWMAGVPVVSTVHGWTPVSLKLRAYEVLDRLALRRFGMVICVSRLLRDQLRRAGLKEDRLVYIPNAVPIPDVGSVDRDAAREKCGLPRCGTVILSVGRLSQEKGLDVLLSAAVDTLKRDAAVRLAIVGDGPMRRQLEDLASSLGIRQGVVFTGHTNDVAQWYAAADLFVLSSHTEGFPMALLEAMAVGLPVVATAVGGVPDIVEDGVNGLLVPSRNVTALADAIYQLSTSPDLSARLAVKARKTVIERYSADQWGQIVEGVYEKIAF